MAPVAEKHEIWVDLAWDDLHRPSAADLPFLIDPMRVHPLFEWLETTHDPPRTWTPTWLASVAKLEADGRVRAGTGGQRLGLGPWYAEQKT